MRLGGQSDHANGSSRRWTGAQGSAAGTPTTIFESNLKERSSRDPKERSQIERSMLAELEHVNRMIEDIDAKIGKQHSQYYSMH